MPSRITRLRDQKKAKSKISCITAYDYSTARLLDSAGIDLLLVGDSLGNVQLGYDTTLPVTVDEMIHHARAVVRARRSALVICDLPFMSYQESPEHTIINAGRIMKETGVDGIKLEGAANSVLRSIRALVDIGIPVMGHLGFTPQSINQLGGSKVQGKSATAAKHLLRQATALEKAGVFALVLELIPATLANKITKSLKIPTIGIGAGAGCDGQILVVNDMLGYGNQTKYKFVREYANLGKMISQATVNYMKDIKNGDFPSKEESF